jgi:hypothetical protein
MGTGIWSARERDCDGARQPAAFPVTEPFFSCLLVLRLGGEWRRVIGRMAALPGHCWHDDESLGPLSRLRALDCALQACASLCTPGSTPRAAPGPNLIKAIDRWHACP